MKQLACRDLGMDCDFIVTAETEEEIMSKGGEHGKEVHGYTDEDFTPEMIDKVKSAIKEVTS